LKNAFVLIAVTEEGIEILPNLLHPEKVEIAIVVGELLIVILVIFEHP
jgi:hypothetical protein